MGPVTALSLLFITVTMLAVGVRLLALWTRTRRLPELAFGLAFAGGALGSAGAQLGQRLLWSEPGAVATALNTGCFGLQVLGTLALYTAIWRVFQLGSRVGTALWALGCGLALLGYALRIAQGDFTSGELGTAGMAVFQTSRALALGWAAWEALTHQRRLRRQLALGLASPVVVNQILLWGVSGITSFGLTAIIAACIFFVGRNPVELGWPMLPITALCIATAGCMWCAFFPPEALRRHLERRVAA